MVADMIVEYDQPLSAILAHLFELVGPHAYRRDDIRFERDGYEQRKQETYRRITENPPTDIAGGAIARTRTDDGFKFYLDDGSWVLVRMSGTEPLMRVYSEAATPARVDEMLSSLEAYLGVEPRSRGHG